MNNILIIGDERRLADFREKTDHLSHDFIEINEGAVLPDLQGVKLIFDLGLDEHPTRLSHYAPQAHLLVIGGAVKRSLAEMVAAAGQQLKCKLAGINALPSFLSRDAWELSYWDEASREKASQLLADWEIRHHFVDDRVGMVTPRIIAMIINEACFTVQEGTASVEGIDQAMRLGVNYPGGPFEWANKIGPRHVYEVLLRLGEDTGDGRYKIAPLLKKIQLKAESFR